MIKRIFVVLSLISMTSVFAGDLYLVCEKNEGADLHSVSLESRQAMMILSIDDETPVLIRVSQTTNTNFTEYKLRLKNLRNNSKESANIKLGQEFQVGSFVCAIRD